MEPQKGSEWGKVGGFLLLKGTVRGEKERKQKKEGKRRGGDFGVTATQVV